MLFNSYDFLFAFLPIVVVVHRWLLGRHGARPAWAWLALSSLFFYAWPYPPYLALLAGSMVVNFLLGRVVADPQRSDRARSAWLTLAIVANLGLLGFYKYADFFAVNLNAATGWSVPVLRWALPLGISFFTFQQVAYVVDARRGVVRERDPLSYVLFVTFFPQLVAGPIVHHAEMMPQFREARAPDATDRAVGLTFLVLGLAKKVLFADLMAEHADLVFGAVAAGREPPVLVAWSGLLAFWFQVYFDFSGYSDMAIGLARLFGIRLPINFDAPYRATSMIDFWNRWHLTLSRFLRDYLYIPLGGGRRGPVRRYANLVITMTLGGLWHGAGWTYVAWGFVNGMFLLVNHGWRNTVGTVEGRAFAMLSRVLTLLCVFYGHVFFRAADLDDALRVHAAMVGWTSAGLGSISPWVASELVFLFVFVQLVPTSHTWMQRFEPVLGRAVDRVRWPARFTWAPTRRWALAIGVLAFLCLPVLERAKPFVYWAF